MIEKLMGLWIRWRVRRAYVKRYGRTWWELEHCIGHLPNTDDRGRRWRLKDAMADVEWDFSCEWDAEVDWWYYRMVGPDPYSKRTDNRRFNGGEECDVDRGPCACGAFHSFDEPEVQRLPLWTDTPRTS